MMSDKIKKIKWLILPIAAIFAIVMVFGLSACKPSDDDDVSQLVEITSVTLDTSSVALKVGESRTLTATVLPANASNKNVTWFSLDPTVATVENGKVTALKAGVTSITAACGLRSANCIVTVSNGSTSEPPPDQKIGITFDKTVLAMFVGEIQSINATVNIAEDNNDLTWFSLDDSVATVENGKVTALKEGATVITAVCGNYSTSCTVSVTPVATTGISLDKTAVSVYIGDSEQLTASVLPSNATNKTVAWLSYDDSVARVVNGKVTGMTDGSTVIVAMSGVFSATCVVTVVDGSVTGLDLDENELLMNIGDTHTFTATVYPDYAKDKTVVWESSDENIVTVENGKVTAMDDGEAEIIGRAGSIEARCRVTVTDPNPVMSISVSGTADAYIDELSLSDYKIATVRKNGDRGNVDLRAEYISAADMAKLSLAGAHTLTVTYKNRTAEWNVTVKNHEFDDAELLPQTFVYDGSVKALVVTGVPDGTEISYENNGKTDSGEYTVTATLSKRYYNTKTLSAVLTIINRDFEGVSFGSSTYLYDGNPKRLYVTNVPDGTDVVYENNDQTEIGEHTVTAIISKKCYNTLTLTATLTIKLMEQSITYVLGYDDVINDNPVKFNVATGLKLVAAKRIDPADGKGFCGWFADSECTIGVTEIKAGTYDAVTLYAKWDLPYKVDENGALSLTVYGRSLTEHTIASEIDGITVTSFADSAFADCKLVKLTVPKSVTKIGANAFAGCNSLTELTVDPDNPVYHVAGNCLIETATKTLIAGFTNSVIPTDGSVLVIGEEAFLRSAITSIIIPECITTIRKRAFASCTSLKEAIFEHFYWKSFMSENPNGALIPSDYFRSVTRAAKELRDYTADRDMIKDDRSDM